MDGTLVDATAKRGSDGLSNRMRRRYSRTMTTSHARLLVLLSAIVAAVALRLVPHPPNFTAIGAMALFSGAYLGRRSLAFAAPLAALVLSDLVIGFYPELLFVYVGVAATVLLGWAVGRCRTLLRVAAAAVVASVLFYLLTNFGVWLVMDYYPKTFAGLIACYVAAIPFFQNTLAGNLFYCGLLFGGLALLERAVPALRPERAPRPA